MTFPLERILTVTATEYCSSVGKELSQFELKGLHVAHPRSRNIIESFREKIPEGTEVIVNYSQNVAAGGGGEYTSKQLQNTNQLPF